MYEQVDNKNKNDDMNDLILPDDLYQLEKKAKYMQKIIDDFETTEAQHQSQKDKKEKPEEAKSKTQPGGAVPNTLQGATKQMQDLSLTKQEKSQSEILADFYRFKQKYVVYSIFVFECVHCSLFEMIHQ
jgi:hypothetical protein